MSKTPLTPTKTAVLVLRGSSGGTRAELLSIKFSLLLVQQAENCNTFFEGLWFLDRRLQNQLSYERIN